MHEALNWRLVDAISLIEQTETKESLQEALSRIHIQLVRSCWCPVVSFMQAVVTIIPGVAITHG